MESYLNKISYLYLHFPFCRHLCNYCDFYKKVPSDNSEVLLFQKQLEDQMNELQGHLRQYQAQLADLKTLYFGGGTPSLWGVPGAKFFSQFMYKHQLSFEKNYEWTMEVNPGSWDASTLDEWLKLGVNRFSLGVQSLDGQFLKLLDRVHGVDDAYDTLREFDRRELNFSVDFMLGLPHSEFYKRDIIQELEKILEFNPSHLSLYILTTKNHYVHQKSLPSEEWIEEEYLAVSHFLQAKGFNHYEVSNFALPGFESHHNLAYWNSESVAALGPSATGLFAQECLRYKWATKEAQIQWEKLSPDELRLERLYMRLRTNLGLNLNDFIAAKHYEDIEKVKTEWVERGLVKCDSMGLVFPTSRGYLMLDSLMDQLFRYM